VRLITAHRILILAAIVFFAFYALIQLRHYLDLAETGALVQGIVAALIVAGLVLYYRTLKGWGQRL
jgi:hypothetical protein